MSNENTDPPSQDDDENDAGYCKPPKKHRWKKGQSGNPSGKKKRRLKQPVSPKAGPAADELTTAIYDALTNPVTKSPLDPSNASGAKWLAHAIVKDAITKDGRSRQQLLDTFLLPYIDPKLFEKVSEDANRHGIITQLAAAVFSPNVSVEEMEQLALQAEKMLE